MLGNKWKCACSTYSYSWGSIVATYIGGTRNLAYIRGGRISRQIWSSKKTGSFRTIELVLETERRSIWRSIAEGIEFGTKEELLRSHGLRGIIFPLRWSGWNKKIEIILSPTYWSVCSEPLTHPPEITRLYILVSLPRWASTTCKKLSWKFLDIWEAKNDHESFQWDQERMGN